MAHCRRAKERQGAPTYAIGCIKLQDRVMKTYGDRSEKIEKKTANRKEVCYFSNMVNLPVTCS